MQVFSKIIATVRQRWSANTLAAQSANTCPNVLLEEAHDRIARLERNYLVLLKRVLEMDGVKLITTKASKLDTKVLQTTGVEDNQYKGLHENKPTMH